MTQNKKKTIATILIAAVSISLFAVLILVQVNDGKTIPEVTGIFFAIFPAIAINRIWNGREKNKTL